MTLGALVDAGVPLEQVQDAIDSLGLTACRLQSEQVKRNGFRATKINVQHEPEHAHRHLHHILRLIDGSRLSPRQQELASRIFTRLAEAEAHVHGTTVEKVHFHEVGAVDSIADIVGAAVAWDLLDVQRIACSPIPTGSGFVQIAHGRVSIPAPATAELLKGIPLAESQVEGELTTPTGAAIAATLAHQFGPLPSMTVETIGYGAGQRDWTQQSNILRLLVGHADQAQATDGSVEQDQVWVLETNLDDVGGEVIGHCCQLLMDAGALDVYSTAIQMKKNRPGVTLTVLCDTASRHALEGILFRETTTIGIRRWLADRHKLRREVRTVATPWGDVAGKLVQLPDGRSRFWPEYEACRQLAAAHGVALLDVYRAACQVLDGQRDLRDSVPLRG